MSSERSNQLIQLPGRIISRPGTPGALVRWSEDVQKAIQQLRDRTVLKGRPPVQPQRGQPLQPHHLRDDSGWKLKFREGFVYQTFPPTTESPTPIERFLIYVGASDHLGTTPAPDVALATVNDYVYLHYKTDDHGGMIGLDDPAETPERFAELIASTAEKNSTHFELPDGAGLNGIEGDYYYEVAKMEADALGDAVYTTGRGWRRNFHNLRGYNALENHTTGCAVYEQYDMESDTKLLRGITGDYGIDCTQTATALDLDLDAVNLGGGEKVYNDLEPNDEAEFRTLVERSTNPQIQLSTIGGPPTTEIRVEGNDNDIDIIFNDCAASEVLRLVFRDGLLQTPVGVRGAGTARTVVLGECPT